MLESLVDQFGWVFLICVGIGLFIAYKLFRKVLLPAIGLIFTFLGILRLMAILNL